MGNMAYSYSYKLYSDIYIYQLEQQDVTPLQFLHSLHETNLRSILIYKTSFAF